MSVLPPASALRFGGARYRWLLTISLAGCGLLSVGWGMHWFGQPKPPQERVLVPGEVDHHPTARVLGAVLLAGAAAFNRLHARYRPAVRATMEEFGRRVDGLSPAARRLDLVLVSVLGLFLEVALIRWHGTEFRACAYLKNITLLACFLGLGLGFARARRPIVSYPLALPLLALQVLAMDALSQADADQAIRTPIAWEVFWGLGTVTGLLHYAVFYGFFGLLFVSTIVIFIPIGQLTGRLLDPAAPIASYTLNIIGSIAGVVLFAGVSVLWLPPAAWFAVAVVLGLWLARHSRGGLAAGGALSAVMIGWLGYEPRPEVRNIYSPYQRLEVQPDYAERADGRRVLLGTAVSANKTYYMQAFDLSEAFVARWGGVIIAVRSKSLAYNLPYRLGPRPNDVLIVGAGAGNDVAAAVRNGAERIDAVEIDPAIHRVGRRHHPESPYQAPRVRSVIDDARAFMKRAPAESYDLIVFGLLDSHTLLSGMASIRLDNFVYTLESMKAARRLLRPGGRLCVSFALGPEGPFSARMYAMLSEAFGHPPRTFELQGNDTLFAVGVRPQDVSGRPDDLPETTETVAGSAARFRTPPATDDWPFPFLTGRTWADFPRPYVYLILLLAGISAAWVAGTAERGTTLDGHFFFLGAAFLLIETKGITELALVFGTTWIVTSVVITAILVLILLGNWLVTAMEPRRVHGAYIGLMVSLLAGYVVPVGALLDRGWLTAAAGSSLLLCLPLFFAAIVFATSLKCCTSLPSAFASNLLGAILGGLCEYGSMMWGFRNLYLVGMGLYALSWLFALRRGASTTTALRAG